ncbi:MAG TPA: PBS lyase [Cyanobacteria bacterium UBA11149]|nr:PBS lyase [Cyanobacteria bacterium UBA11153]HBW89945.1 PBS lyase [Cyanobacteria bacterium UBA11149]
MISNSSINTEESPERGLDPQFNLVCQFLEDIEEHFKYKILLHSRQIISRKTLYIPIHFTLERNYRHEIETFWGYGESEAQLKDTYTIKSREAHGKNDGFAQPKHRILWEDGKKQHHKLMILADPGMGKSALLRREAALIASEEKQKLLAGDITLDEAIFPIFIRLADLDEARGEIIDIIPKLVGKIYHKNWLEIEPILLDKLRQGKCILLFNALDEVPKERRNQLADKINGFLDNYPCPIICTSRIVGYGGAFIKGAKELEIVPFSQPQIEAFIQKWFAEVVVSEHGGLAEGLIEELRQKPQLRGLAQNPRLLYLLCTLYGEKEITIPARRCEIYAKTVDYLLGKWSVKSESQSPEYIQAKIRLLSDLAYRFTCQGKDIFDPDELIYQIGEYLKDDSVKSQLNNATPEALLSELSGENGILHKLAKESERYVFIHRFTQDYLTACYLKQAIAENLEEGIALAKEHFWEYDWHQPLSLLAGLMENPLPLLEAITREKDDIFSTLLLLAGQAIAECEENVNLSEKGENTENLKSDNVTKNEEHLHRLIPEIIDHIYKLWQAYPFVGFIASTVVALGQANSQMLQQLETELSEKRYYTRKDFIAAVIAILGQIGSPQAVETLIKALNEGPWYVRAESAAALGRIGTTQAFNALIKALNDDDNSVRGEVAEALGKIGTPEAIKGLVIALHDDDSYVRGEAAVALAKIGTAEASHELIKVLNHPDKFVRWEATAACHITSPSVLRSLINALNHYDRNIREEAAMVLGRIGTSVALKALVPALRDNDRIVREEAAEALMRASDPQTINALIPALCDRDRIVRADAAQALGRIGSPQALNALSEAIHDEDSEVKKYVAEALGEIGTLKALDILIPALQDRNSEVRGAAATALGKIGSERAVNALIPSLQDQNWLVRDKAAVALSRIGTKETFEKLLQLPKQYIYRPEIYSLIRTLAVRFSREKIPLIPVYPELIEPFGFIHQLWRKLVV